MHHQTQHSQSLNDQSFCIAVLELHKHEYKKKLYWLYFTNTVLEMNNAYDKIHHEFGNRRITVIRVSENVLLQCCTYVS